jgi:hypothetical protein
MSMIDQLSLPADTSQNDLHLRLSVVHNSDTIMANSNVHLSSDLGRRAREEEN